MLPISIGTIPVSMFPCRYRRSRSARPPSSSPVSRRSGRCRRDPARPGSSSRSGRVSSPVNMFLWTSMWVTLLLSEVGTPPVNCSVEVQPLKAGHAAQVRYVTLSMLSYRRSHTRLVSHSVGRYPTRRLLLCSPEPCQAARAAQTHLQTIEVVVREPQVQVGQHSKLARYPFPAGC